ncbi:hypothetical protein [Cyprinid herpesvirus 2]|uniref:ORF2 n=1 Tax=Cyprinid herpesvirus 2 TaxID=317878 RepID=K7PCP9_CYHV2|nr:protein ORF2 [Cyprinid herpesvirus 2]AFJ20585.1 protein ORF2 [Cyprinid herpesvirus 2]AKC02102.1 hypothetical protein [Cyprinid herpesvirus 2]AMB21730.1 ORF2 [Cyprinid herpesvirus 2]
MSAVCYVGRLRKNYSIKAECFQSVGTFNLTEIQLRNQSTTLAIKQPLSSYPKQTMASSSSNMSTLEATQAVPEATLVPEAMVTQAAASTTKKKTRRGKRAAATLKAKAKATKRSADDAAAVPSKRTNNGPEMPIPERRPLAEKSPLVEMASKFTDHNDENAKNIFFLGKDLYDLAGKLSQCYGFMEKLEDARELMMDTSKPLHEAIHHAARYCYKHRCEMSEDELRENPSGIQNCNHYVFVYDPQDHREARAKKLYNALKRTGLKLMGLCIESIAKETPVRCTVQQVCATMGRPVLPTEFELSTHGSWVEMWFTIVSDYCADNFSNVFYMGIAEAYPATQCANSTANTRDYSYTNLPTNRELWGQWVTGRCIVELAYHMMMAVPDHYPDGQFTSNHHICTDVTITDLFVELRRARLHTAPDGVIPNVFSGLHLPQSVMDLPLMKLKSFTTREKVLMKNVHVRKLGLLDAPVINETILEHMVSKTHPGHNLKSVGHSLMLAAHLGALVNLAVDAPLYKHHRLSTLMNNMVHADCLEHAGSPKTYINLTKYHQPTSCTITCTAVYKPSDVCRVHCGETCSQLRATMRVLCEIDMVTSKGTRHIMKRDIYDGEELVSRFVDGTVETKLRHNRQYYSAVDDADVDTAEFVAC